MAHTQGVRVRIGRFAAGLALAAALLPACLPSAQAQQRNAASLAYLRDMPAPDEVMAAIQGNSPAQTMGRQCAAMERIMRGGMFPDLQFRSEAQPVAERYRQALAALERRYSATIKPLSNADNAAEWHRMCRNARSGIHPITGKAEAGWPALEQPVTVAEITALFKPTVRAAYEAGLRSNAQQAATQKARAEVIQRNQEARQERERAEKLRNTVIYGGSGVALIAFIAWLAVATSRMGWRVGEGGRTLLINRRPYTVVQHGGFLRAASSKNEVVINPGGRAPNGTVYSASSTTIVHDYLRLLRPDGSEYDVHLRDWDIAPVPGDVLQFYTLEYKGKRAPDYLVIVNRQTGAVRRNLDGWLRRQLSPMNGVLAFSMVVASGFVTLGLGWLVGGAWLWYWNRTTGRCEKEIHDWLRHHEPLPPVPANLTPAD